MKAPRVTRAVFFLQARPFSKHLNWRNIEKTRARILTPSCASLLPNLCLKVECLIMYPLDVVKTVQQLKVGQGEGTFKILMDIFRREKLGIYRGIGAPLLMETPKRAIKFTAVRTFSPLSPSRPHRRSPIDNQSPSNRHSISPPIGRALTPILDLFRTTPSSPSSLVRTRSCHSREPLLLDLAPV